MFFDVRRVLNVSVGFDFEYGIRNNDASNGQIGHSTCFHVDFVARKPEQV